MDFKTWIIQELKLDMSANSKSPSSPTQQAKATDSVANKAMQQDGGELATNIQRAMSPAAGLKVATDVAKKAINSNAPQASQTDVSQVAGKLFQMTTGQEPKTT